MNRPDPGCTSPASRSPRARAGILVGIAAVVAGTAAALCAGSGAVDAAPRRPASKPPPRAPAPAAARSPELEPLKAKYEAAEARQASFAAARIARQGVALAVQTTGPDSSDTEVWRQRLINALVRTGDTAGLVAANQDVLASAERRYGPDSREVLIAVEGILRAYPSNSHFDEREALMQRVLAMTEKRYGERSIQFAEALDGQARLLWDHGEYSARVPVLEHSLQIREAIPHDDDRLAAAVRDLAEACWWAGQRARAIGLFDRMLALTGALAARSGVPDRKSADILWSVVVVYDQGGRNDLARPLAAKAAALYETEIAELERDKPDSPELLQLVGYLSSAYYQDGDLARSDALLERAYAIAARRGDTTVYGQSLAFLRRQQGKPREALALFERAQADMRKISPQSAIYSDPLIADVLCDLGEFARAERLRAGYRASMERSFGRHSAMYGYAELGDVPMYVAMGKLGLAEQAMTDAFEISERELQRALQVGTEADHAMSLSRDRYQLDTMLNFELDHAPRSPSVARLGLTTVLRRKGRTLDAIASDLEAVRARLSPEDRRLLDELASARAQLARLTVAGPSATDGDYPRQVAGYEDQIQKLEIQLGRRSTAYRAATAPITLAAVQQAIPPGARLVEITAFQTIDGKARFVPNRTAIVTRYAAYVAGRTGDPVVVDLGPAAPIDDAIEQLRQALSDPADDHVRERGHALYALTMARLAPALGGATSVLIAPDGALNVVPFAALVDDHGDYLIKRFTFTYLTSGRDLVRLAHPARSRSAGAIFADPTFDAAPGASPAAPASRGRRSSDMTRQTWQPLPGTAQEADAIALRLPKLAMYRGARATETALKALHGPRILHIATHGFFLDDQQPLVAAQSSPSSIQSAPSYGEAHENPLLRAGLVFAGANQLASGDDDGILTAMEASSLDLAGTQLVVASACETGVGKVTNGEGVYGLRRALVIAGAESLVMSLWPVDDEATRDLMAGFYAGLSIGAPRSSALRAVQLAILARPAFAHPYYWASFVPTGDDTPLR